MNAFRINKSCWIIVSFLVQDLGWSRPWVQAPLQDWLHQGSWHLRLLPEAAALQATGGPRSRRLWRAWVPPTDGSGQLSRPFHIVHIHNNPRLNSPNWQKLFQLIFSVSVKMHFWLHRKIHLNVRTARTSKTTVQNQARFVNPNKVQFQRERFFLVNSFR